ncbi:YdcF family protein [Vagococcus coleopterorum]|uniref:YdcF family protein n=1 Tax=Vagococcus coleopterorum TaxID=2714946 RepID=A0A6G8ALM3_9ENTE|nr:YdcF family protein [Vagococcus coleopterorum]QIL45859.1 YdcF family protein [Vagococcus coleopterorum]
MQSLIFFLIFLLPIFLFGFWVVKKPTSLWTGFWFLGFISIITVLLILLIERLSQPVAVFIGMILALILIGLSLFGIYAMIIALFWNERILLKHERKSFANMLPLLVATALILLELILFIGRNNISNKDILSIFSFMNTSFLYFALLFILYGITTILFNLYPIKSQVDYIIVLGAGLYNDKVTPLLASRIEAGIKLYYQQEEKGYAPILILSGGQGADEGISEAQAMLNYIDEKGYTIDRLRLEDKSTTTRENLLFSQTIARKKDGITDFSNKKVVVASNNYHILRAGKIADSLDIPVRGVGAKTRLYYLPTAFIREYIGYLVMSKKTHLVVIGFLFIILVIPLFFKLFI